MNRISLGIRSHPKTYRDPSAPPQDDENLRHSERSEESRSTISGFGMAFSLLVIGCCFQCTSKENQQELDNIIQTSSQRKLKNIPLAMCQENRYLSQINIVGLFEDTKAQSFRGMQIYGKIQKNDQSKPINFIKKVHAVQILKEENSNCFIFRAFLFDATEKREVECTQRVVEYWQTPEIYPKSDLRKLLKDCSHDIGKPRVIEITRTQINGSIKGKECKYQHISYYVKKDALRPIVKENTDFGGTQLASGNGCQFNSNGILQAAKPQPQHDEKAVLVIDQK